ncbi:hypothetical protein D1AOALGA4SA_5939 [Olavius algarvensis Delta 1 endosymbiont]|nr:hypothetical protein D1AOALGA4SA_5939 [Olavius algarvensis Delta 1 endosymbiont]
MKFDTEKRRYKRFKYEALISHDISTNGNIHPGRMLDFSKGGLYFESDKNILSGEVIFLGLDIRTESPGYDTQIFFEVKIVWKKALEGLSYGFGYGGKFLTSNDSLKESKNFDKKNDSLPSDGFSSDHGSRKHLRKPYNKAFLFYYESIEYKGFAANIGRGGAFILTKEPAHKLKIDQNKLQNCRSNILNLVNVL